MSSLVLRFSTYTGAPGLQQAQWNTSRHSTPQGSGFRTDERHKLQGPYPLQSRWVDLLQPFIACLDLPALQAVLGALVSTPSRVMVRRIKPCSEQSTTLLASILGVSYDRPFELLHGSDSAPLVASATQYRQHQSSHLCRRASSGSSKIPTAPSLSKAQMQSHGSTTPVMYTAIWLRKEVKVTLPLSVLRWWRGTCSKSLAHTDARSCCIGVFRMHYFSFSLWMFQLSLL